MLLAVDLFNERSNSLIQASRRVIMRLAFSGSGRLTFLQRYISKLKRKGFQKISEVSE